MSQLEHILPTTDNRSTKCEPTACNSHEYWQHNPTEAFKNFINSTAYLTSGLRNPIAKTSGRIEYLSPIRKSSQIVFNAMFNRFARWMMLNKLSVFTVTNKHILAFLDEETPVSSKQDQKAEIGLYRFRYIRLLERVFRHLEICPNPASILWEKIRNGTNHQERVPKSPPVALTMEQESSFMRALADNDTRNGGLWKRRRDRAMMTIMLGAGLTVSEVIALRLEHVAIFFGDGAIKIHVAQLPNATTLSRDIVMKPQYAEKLLEWRYERLTLNVSGRLLFPANIDGDTLSKATVFRQVKATFAQAGLDSLDHQGGRTLRNTFALRELADGTPMDELCILMGYQHFKSVKQLLPLVSTYRSNS